MPDPVKLGDPLPLGPDALERLGGEVAELQQELEESHQSYFDDISVWWSWYHAEPEVEWRTDPFDGASNLSLPIIQSQIDPFVARTLLQLLSSADFYSASSQNEELAELIPSVLEVMNWGIHHQPSVGLLDSLEPGVCEQQVIGEAIWQQVWMDRQKPVVTPSGQVKLVSFGAGPVMIHRPRQRYLFPRTTTIGESEFVFVQDFHSWGQLCRIAQQDPKAITSAFTDLQTYAGIEGKSAELENESRARSGQSPLKVGGRFEPHDIRTIYLEYPMAQLLSSLRGLPKVNTIREQKIDEVATPIELKYHAKSRRILKATYSPYLLDSLPFYMATRKRGGSATEAGRGAAKDLEHLQRAINTHVNQASDAVTVGNSVKLFTNSRDLLNKRWAPNRINYLSDPQAGLKEIGQGVKNIIPDMSLLSYFQTMTERIGGAADPIQGMEKRMGGHPSPATNFLGMIQQSQINSSRSLKSLREALSKMAEHRALMYQQFETNKGDWIGSRFDSEDRDNFMRFLRADSPIYGQITWDVNTLSEIHNPDAERAKAVQIYQLVSNHTVTVAKIMETLGNQQAPPMLKQWLTTSAEGLQKTVEMLLETYDLDEVEDYVGKLELAQQQGAGVLQQLLAQARGLPAAQLGPGAGAGGAGALVGGGGAPVPGVGVAPIPGAIEGLVRGGNGAGGGMEPQ